MNKKLSKHSGLIIVSLVYLTVFLIMLPLRHFAYEDDFAYYNTVQNLLLHRDLSISEWAATSLIFQVFWGSLFSLLFGFSYQTLHFSTAVLFYFGIISFYLTLKVLDFNTKKSVIFTTILLSFPNIIRLTFSFMTDIPYLSLMLITIFFGVKSLKTGSTKLTFISTIFAMFAFLVRQLGIAWPLSLFVAFLLKSFYYKKIYLKQMLVIIFVTVSIFFAYQNWLGNGNQTNAQYLFVTSNFKVIKERWFPVGTHRLRPTNEIYDEVIHRSGIYTTFILGFLGPMLLLFKISPRKFAKTNKMAFILGVICLGLIYARLSIREPRFPQILPEALRGNELLWRKYWNYQSILLFVPWAYVIGNGLVQLNKSLFTKKNKIYFNKFFVISIGIILIAGSYISRTLLKEGMDVYPYLFFIFLWTAAALIPCFYIFLFKLKTNKILEAKNSIATFLIIGTLIQLAITTLSFFAWQHYIIPFAPLLILGIVSSLKNIEISTTRSVFVLILLLWFSLFSAKTDYDSSSIKWEVAEVLVNEGLVKPVEVGISDWAWIPYFYHEESFQKRLNEMGGDKTKITQIHTWWDDEEYKYKDQKLNFLAGNCNGSISPKTKNTLLVQEIRAKSLFRKYEYCLTLDLEN